MSLQNLIMEDTKIFYFLDFILFYYIILYKFQYWHAWWWPKKGQNM